MATTTMRDLFKAQEAFEQAVDFDKTFEELARENDFASGLRACEGAGIRKTRQNK